MKRPLPANFLLLSFIFMTLPFQAVLSQVVNQPRVQRSIDLQSQVTDTISAVRGSEATPGSRFSMGAGSGNISAAKYKVYPVPAQNDITVSGTEDVNLLEIYDVTGKKVISEECDGESVKPMNISRLARGIYFIRLTTPKGAVMKRFIKE